MYQTVGHDIIQLYQDAMGIPLYRQRISGTNIQQKLHYTESAGDETEDLYLLMRKVLDSHPEITAVSVGAIASNYQRLRVENVAARLNLTVLAFLWERDQTELLHELITSDVNAIIIKVACVGLNQTHLGLTLAQIEPTMMKLHRRYGVHPCGEGGEYETIVLDCPLFRKKLKVIDQETIALEGDTAYLKLKATLEDKSQPAVWELPAPGLDEEIAALLPRFPCEGARPFAPLTKPLDLEPSTTTTSAGNLTLTRKISSDLTFPPLDRPERIIFTFLILSSMTDFQTLNKQYQTLFQSTPQPPPRVCIASSQIPTPIKSILYTLSTNEDSKRYWVQAQSYWVPASIGPYSLIAKLETVALTAGQIGLIPSSMTLAPSVAEEVAWSLQSLMRVVKSQGVDRWDRVAVCFVVGDLVDLVRFVVREYCQGMEYVVVRLCEGSSLPRGAKIEWQLVASEPGSESSVSIDGDSNGIDLWFYTAQGQPDDSVWAVQCDSIFLADKEVSHCRINIAL